MELGYCVEHAIPHSVWLEDWTPEDRSKVVAYLMEQNTRCDMCGTAPWEWEENKFAYEAVDHFCKGCYLKSVYSSSQSESLAGTNVMLIPVTPERVAEREVLEQRRRELSKRDREAERDRRAIGADR